MLFDAWREAFAGRDDVTLVLKDFGANGIYRNAGREPIREHSPSGALPRIVLIDEDLSTDELAALYRACDVLVHPYRGEGFAMPVLEAMACGLPAIVTAGGPTDEFLPADAGWRIDARPVPVRRGPHRHAGDPRATVDPRARPGASGRAAARGRRRRGRRARRPAAAPAAPPPRAYSWDAVAARYQERITALAAPPSPAGQRRRARALPARGGGRPARAGHARLAPLGSSRRAAGRVGGGDHPRDAAPACTCWPIPASTASPRISRPTSCRRPRPRGSTSRAAPTSTC